MDTEPNLNRRRFTPVKRKIAEGTSHKTFYVCVSNLAKKKTYLPKAMTVAQGGQNSPWLTSVNKKGIQDETVNTVPFHDSTNGVRKQAHKWAKTNQLRRDGTNGSNKAGKWNLVQCEILEVAIPASQHYGLFNTIWYQHFHRLIGAKHQTDPPELEKRSKYQNAHCAGLRHCKLGKSETKTFWPDTS